MTPEFKIKLNKIKRYLDTEGISNAVNNEEVVFEMNKRTYRTPSLYEAKKIVKRERHA